jgi:hypothetical protein
MAYDPKADHVVFDGGSVTLEDGTSLTVELKSYAGGAEKVAINRTFSKRNGDSITKAAGRLAVGEYLKVFPLLEKVNEFLVSRGND